MASRNLPTREMVALTRSMVDPTHEDHHTIMARPMLATCMPELTAAHTDVVGVHRIVDIKRRYQELVVEQGVTDHGHDNSMRGIWYRLKAEEYLARTPEDAAMFRDLRKWLFPGGLAMVNLSYREEIGHAEMIAGQITPTQEALLERLGTYDSNMLEAVRTWLAQADRLGQLEHERSGMEVRGDGRGISSKARSRWIRIIAHMRRAAEFLGDDPDVAEIMDRIARAEQQAAKRGSRRAGPDDDTGSRGDADTEISGDTGDTYTYTAGASNARADGTRRLVRSSHSSSTLTPSSHPSGRESSAGPQCVASTESITPTVQFGARGRGRFDTEPLLDDRQEPDQKKLPRRAGARDTMGA